jgi:osmotically-inducible protein OsmY
VKSVKNDIAITQPAAGPTLGENIDDASITSQVKFALLRNNSTSALKTKVKTNDGIVRVTGDASSDAQKSLVTKLALDVRGTKSVTNDMVVKS